MNILRKINFSQKISKRIMKNAEYFKDFKKQLQKIFSESIDL